jgi:hypothetical protein
VAAESETPREVLRLAEARRAARRDIPGPPSNRMLQGAESELEQMHNYITRIWFNLHEAIGISSGAIAELCIQELHVHTRQPCCSRRYATRGRGVHSHVAASS